MTPILPCSTSNVSLIPGTALTLSKNNRVTRCGLSRKPNKRMLALPRLVLPPPTFVTLIPRYRRDCALLHRSVVLKLSATGTDVAVEEPNSPVVDEDSVGASETPAEAVEKGETSTVKSDASPAPAQSRRSRPVRKSEMPPVKNEDLVPGAIFTGKVRSIQPFGAFIDFGAFTEGLVHVSQLSDSFVKDVASIVSIGQEVKVRLVEANMETGRISLTMRESDDSSKQKDGAVSSDKPRPARRNTPKPGQRREEAKISKFVRGQDLEGTVKNLTRSGAFISLPEGEEGFLPSSEESDDGLGNMMGGSSLQVGQDVSVRVLRITRGQVTLTMKKEEDNENLGLEVSQGVIHAATNPFVLAFRQNKDIATFLDEREKVEKMAKMSSKPKTSEETGDPVKQVEITSDIPQTHEQLTSGDEGLVPGTSSAVDNAIGDDVADENLKPEIVESSTLQSDDIAAKTVDEEADENSARLDPETSVSTINEMIEESSSTDLVESDEKSDSSGETIAQVTSSESLVSEEVSESKPSDVQIQTLGIDNEVSTDAPIEKNGTGVALDENGSIGGSALQPENASLGEAKDEAESIESFDPSEDSNEAPILSSESQAVEEVTENEVGSAKDEVLVQTPSAVTEISAAQFEDKKVDHTPEKDDTFSGSNGQGGSPPTENANKATISPALVKQLRDETGAGMMDCKKALSETGGDIVKAQEFLRKKGLASAEKKASRATAEGRIGSYIHDSRIGVLIEVNCETDFVSRGDIFKELVDDLSMQVAACPQVQYLVTDDVPEDIVNKERDIEMQKEDLLSKPEQIRSRIVEGRIRKRLEELALLEQPYIKNDKTVVKDWVKQTIATIGENIKVKRFVRYNLGEGLEKKSQDFAAEVAAQTAAKQVAAPPKDQPAVTEAKETAQKPAAVTVSAALVKQLREETGAGMMDCKKALSETGGDLEKAQEYLRKKGLSTADKKSSRLAAEGRIGSYIHDSRIGVLIEVNCETDFVGRSEKFKELVDDLAMQVVACPQVQFVSMDEIPEDIMNKEKELEMQREDLLSKPENIREKIVEGRVSKRLGELALLEQPFIKNDSVLVKDLVKQTVAGLGENIKVRRFVRFTLGETAEDSKSETEA